MKRRIALLLGCLIGLLLGNLFLDVVLLTQDDQLQARLVEEIEAKYVVRSELGSASYPLFGEIKLTNLVVYTKDFAESEGTPLLRISEAQISPNLIRLLTGGGLVSQVTLDRVDLRIVRDSEGVLNFDTIFPPSPEAEKGRPRKPLLFPDTRIKRLRLEFLDLSQPDAHLLQLPEIDISIASQVVKPGIDRFRVSMLNPRLGRMNLEVSIDRERSDRVLIESVGDEGLVYFDRELRDLLSPEAQKAWQMIRPKGRVRVKSLKVAFANVNGQTVPTIEGATLRLQDASINYALFPLPLRKLNGLVTVIDNQVTVDLKGQAALDVGGRPKTMSVSVDGTLTGERLDDPTVDLKLSFDNVYAGPSLFAVLTDPRVEDIPYDKLRAVAVLHAGRRRAGLARFDPSGGPLKLTLTIRRKEGSTQPADVEIKIDLAGGVDASYQYFPYRLYDIHGQLVIHGKRVFIPKSDPLVGRTEDRKGKVQISGTVVGVGRKATVDLRILAESLPLDDKIKAALHPNIQKNVWEKLRPSGRANVNTYLNHTPADDGHLRTRIEIEPNGMASIQPTAFAARIDRLTGKIVIDNDRVLFGRETKVAVETYGFYRDQKISGNGSIVGKGAAARTDITLSMASLQLDDALYRLLHDDSKRGWDRVLPSGTVRLAELAITQKPNQPKPEIRLRILAEGEAAIKPEVFPLTISALKGEVRIGASGEVAFDRITGESEGGSFVVTKGQIGGNGDQADRSTLHLAVKDLQFTAAVIKAMPPGLRAAAEKIGFSGRLAHADLTLENRKSDKGATTRVGGTLTLADLTIGKKGEVQKLRATLTLAPKSSFSDQGQFTLWGTLKDGRFKLLDTWSLDSMDCAFEVKNGGLEFTNITGGIAGGVLKKSSYFRLIFGETTGLRAAADLEGVEIDRLKYGLNRPPEAKELQGLLNGLVTVKGEMGDPKTLTGNGTVSVTEAQIWNLPVLLNIFNILPRLILLKAPEMEVVSQGEATIKIENERVLFKEVNLESDSLALTGDGEVTFDGELDFKLEAERLTSIPILDWVMGQLVGRMIPLSVTGTLEKPEIGVRAPLGIGG